MELVHEFSVPVPVEQAWQVLTDVERIAPCLPGAELTGVDGDAYHGQVKIKVGPITAQYRGTASFTEKDEARHRVVLKASGRDTRGQGNASATVTAQMAQADGGTTVSIVTDLSISGRAAQFGRHEHGVTGQRVHHRRQPPGDGDGDEQHQEGARAHEGGLPPPRGRQPVQRPGQAQQPPRRTQHEQRGRHHRVHHELHGLGDDVLPGEPLDGQAGHEQGSPGRGEPGPAARHQGRGSPWAGRRGRG